MSPHKPRVLDLFCGAGGAAKGYQEAGFYVVGVDIVDQPRYAGDRFIKADALDVLEYDGLGSLEEGWSLLDVDLIHASPPCQAHTTMGNRWLNPRWPDLIAQTRAMLQASGIPYIIENVSGARSSLINPVELTGEMFGLPVHRPRLFELGGWTCLVPARPPRQDNPVAVYGKPDGRRLWDRKDGTRLSAWASVEEGREALGVPWMTDELEIREAIPPAYSRYLGEQFLSQPAALVGFHPQPACPYDCEDGIVYTGHDGIPDQEPCPIHAAQPEGDD